MNGERSGSGPYLIAGLVFALLTGVLPPLLPVAVVLGIVLLVRGDGRAGAAVLVLTALALAANFVLLG